MYEVDGSCLAHSSDFSFPMIPQRPETQFRVNLFLSASSLRRFQISLEDTFEFVSALSAARLSVRTLIR